MNFKLFYRLRNNAIRREDGKLKLLLANFSGTKQKKDIEKRNSVIEDFFRIKIDVKPWRKEKEPWLDNPSFDWSDKKNVMKSMTLVGSFDMPSWARYAMKGKSGKEALSKKLNDYCEVFIYQLKACNLSCPYCFVDDFNKNGKEANGAKFVGMDEIVNALKKEDEKRKKEANKGYNRLRRIRCSGGEPTITVEQWLSVLKELEKRNLNVHVQSDTNLTTGRFLDELEKHGDLEKNILEKTAEYKNFSLLCSFKGTDKANFHHNTRANPNLFEEQIYSFEKIVKAGIDAYPFFYNPNPATLEPFLEKLAAKFGDEIFLKSWVLPLKIYGPLRERLGSQADNYEKEWESNFAQSEEKMQDILRRKFGLDYKNFLRAGIKLKVKR